MQIINARKIEMTQVFLEDGTVVPVTKVLVEGEMLVNKGDVVDVAGTSKGKGFAGVVKRWGFHGGPKSHGQKDRLRAPGSIGGGTDPGRVWKGKKMPGRDGGVRVTVKNLRVVDVWDDMVILLKGAVPGVRNCKLELKVRVPALVDKNIESETAVSGEE